MLGMQGGNPWALALENSGGKVSQTPTFFPMLLLNDYTPGQSEMEEFWLTKPKGYPL